MKVKEKKTTIVFIAISIFAIIFATLFLLQAKEKNNLQAQLQDEINEKLTALSDKDDTMAKLKDEQSRAELLSERVEAVNAARELDAENFEQEKNALQSQIDALTEDVYYFDSAAIEEEIKEIGELATVEYRYTNVGTLDSYKAVSILNKTLDLKFTKKTAIITMDGVIKVGVDVNKIKISSNEKTKVITVTIPKAKILSNELDETSIQVYDESDGLFNKVTVKDDSVLRSQIKDKSEENAKNNGVYDQAVKNAQLILRCMLESIPGLKDTYTIAFK